MRLSEWLVGIMFGAFLADYKGNDLKYQIKNKVNKKSLQKYLVYTGNFLGGTFIGMATSFHYIGSPALSRNQNQTKPYCSKYHVLFPFTKNRMAFMPLLDFLRLPEWLCWISKLVSFFACFSGAFKTNLFYLFDPRNYHGHTFRQFSNGSIFLAL